MNENDKKKTGPKPYPIHLTAAAHYDPCLRVNEAAGYARLNTDSVREAVRMKEITALKIGTGPSARIRIRLSEVNRWLNGGPAAPKPNGPPYPPTPLGRPEVAGAKGFDPCLTPKEAGQYTALHVETVRDFIRTNDIRAAKLGDGPSARSIIRLSELNRWVQSKEPKPRRGPRE